jgi:hypothetical protein
LDSGWLRAISRDSDVVTARSTKTRISRTRIAIVTQHALVNRAIAIVVDAVARFGGGRAAAFAVPLVARPVAATPAAANARRALRALVNGAIAVVIDTIADFCSGRHLADAFTPNTAAARLGSRMARPDALRTTRTRIAILKRAVRTTATVVSSAIAVFVKAVVADLGGRADRASARAIRSLRVTRPRPGNAQPNTRRASRVGETVNRRARNAAAIPITARLIRRTGVPATAAIAVVSQQVFAITITIAIRLVLAATIPHARSVSLTRPRIQRVARRRARPARNSGIRARPLIARVISTNIPISTITSIITRNALVRVITRIAPLPTTTLHALHIAAPATTIAARVRRATTDRRRRRTRRRTTLAGDRANIAARAVVVIGSAESIATIRTTLATSTIGSATIIRAIDRSLRR